MSDIAIRAENLSKKFMLGERLGFKTFRETLQDSLVSPLRRIIRGEKNGLPAEEKVDNDRRIWALKDVSFEVKHGEVLGIIGPNGAGKSTLLKILSRITEPTAGYAEIRGRVGSLLEVGTGFHPELTGRENVYLNGSILGMSKAEIRRKFDDIVSFAGVEKFIDTPVKRYSSGMQVRLAFAVAAHLDPEILIIDEVLAVGDAEFQKRCLGKMNEVSRSGRTVLFVSHNMAAVEGLCTRVLSLDMGRIATDGDPVTAIQTYLLPKSASRPIWFQASEPPGSQPAIYSVTITNEDGKAHNTIKMGTDVQIAIRIVNIRCQSDFEFSLRFTDSLGRRVMTCNNLFQHPRPIRLRKEDTIQCVVHDCRLAPGTYSLEVYARANGVLLAQKPLLQFEMVPADLYGTSRYLPPHTCVWAPNVAWNVPSA
ncbi:MAG: ABC transporter ATP-binding protein [Thermogutta sp.]|nr:ABC transporter ATP-binding protein [Thermogutta sp.]